MSKKIDHNSYLTFSETGKDLIIEPDYYPHNDTFVIRINIESKINECSFELNIKQAELLANYILTLLK